MALLGCGGSDNKVDIGAVISLTTDWLESSIPQLVTPPTLFSRRLLSLGMPRLHVLGAYTPF